VSGQAGFDCSESQSGRGQGPAYSGADLKLKPSFLCNCPASRRRGIGRESRQDAVQTFIHIGDGRLREVNAPGVASAEAGAFNPI